MIQQLVRFCLYFTIKVIGRVFFTPVVNYVSTEPKSSDWDDVRIICFLNHTSLYEPLFFTTLPTSFLWRCSGDVVAPVADKTVNRPLVGQIFNLLTPKMVSISRKRDDTWEKFMTLVKEGHLVVIFPEGRMKRADGLDNKGNPMSIRGGIYDILQLMDHGKMLIAYSGGLHHVQVPDQGVPHFFKKIRMNLELVSISDLKETFYGPEINPREGRVGLIMNLEDKMAKHSPPSEFPYPKNVQSKKHFQKGLNVTD